MKPLEAMAGLTVQQIRQLTTAMDQRWQREWDEIQAVTRRSQDERDQQVLAEPPTLTDAALREILAGADDAVVRQDVQDLRDIAGARKRIATGTYGTCLDCGADIGYPRLQAYPTAKRCIECQRTHESAALRRARAARQ